jgi:hypothetical protein
MMLVSEPSYDVRILNCTATEAYVIVSNLVSTYLLFLVFKYWIRLQITYTYLISIFINRSCKSGRMMYVPVVFSLIHVSSRAISALYSRGDEPKHGLVSGAAASVSPVLHLATRTPKCNPMSDIHSPKYKMNGLV